MVDLPEFPYCNGCGHTWINKSLGQALELLGEKPTKINLVTDIGCVGLVDKLFLTNTIHTTHGRSTAVATGMQLADTILFDNDAKHIVMIGDGGSTIGLLHLVEAAKINCDITVILHNNFVYGMTGGQNSGLTPEHFRTATTMEGNLSPSLQIAKLLEAAHAPYISRKLATDRDLDQAILEAIKYPGFALIEIIELCTAYATKWNPMSKTDVAEILERIDSGVMGEIVKRDDRKTYSQNYKAVYQASQTEAPRKTIKVNASHKLDKAISIVVSGSAGEGVQFASKQFIVQAVEQGLNVVQKNDNPVTISTGFSLTEIKISSAEILYSAITVPDYLLISSADGLTRAANYLENIINSNQESILILDSNLTELFDTYLKQRGLNRHPAKPRFASDVDAKKVGTVRCTSSVSKDKGNFRRNSNKDQFQIISDDYRGMNKDRRSISIEMLKVVNQRIGLAIS